MSERLRFGLIPDEANAGLAEDLARATADHLRVEVEVHRATDYRVLSASLEQGRIDLAWLPPIGAARLVTSGAVRELALTMRNGQSTYLTGLFALRESPIETIGDLRGVRAAWVDRESASGYVVIRAALRQMGVSLVSAFSDEVFVRSHSEIARALATRTVDVGATCFNYVSGTVEIARSGFKDHGGLRDADVRLVAQAGPIPADMLAAHRSVPQRLVTALTGALVEARSPALHAAAKALVHADGFVRPTPDHREMLVNLLRVVDAGKTIPPPGR